MNFTSFSFSSANQQTLHAYSVLPNETPKACILLVHGLGEHSARYLHVAEFFSAHGFAFYSYDQIGHGKSSKKFGHAKMVDLMADIDTLKQHIQTTHGKLPIFLFGHSMGGCIALAYTMQYQPDINNLIVTAPALRPGFKPAAWKLALARIAYKFLPSITQPNELDTQFISRDTDVISQYIADPLVSNLISVQLACDLLETGEKTLENAAQPLICDTLLMHGDADQLTCFNSSLSFAEKNPSTQIKVWPGLYHELFNEPEKLDVMDYTLQWIYQHNPNLL